MSWKNVKLIFLREVRDQLRDRRTLFMIAILPLLLYPALGIGMIQMMVLFSEQPRTVVILGEENLPDQPELQLIKDNRFVRNYFTIPSDADKLNVYTDTDVEKGKETNAAVERVVPQGQRIRELVEKQQALTAAKTQWQSKQALAAAKTGDTPPPFPEQAELTATKRELSELVEGVQVILIIPEGFGEHIEEMNRKLAKGELGGIEKEVSDKKPIILRNSADEKSLVAFNRVREAINSWEEVILEKRLSEADLPKTLAEPVQAEQIDLAEEKQLSAFVWSKMFPALLIIMALTGAFYPAVDLAAGEKERGTMETLLICPASRTEIVLGKFFTVMVFSVSTAILNLISMGLTGKFAAPMMNSGAFAKIGNLQPPSLASLLWIAVLIIPLSALFSALCLALATFARSTKEGQYYLTPLLMVTMGLTIFCLAPGIEIEPFYSVMPVVGAALLLKEMLANPESNAALYYGIPVLITSVGYSLIALWWAIDQFAREDVLFREAERFELRLWLSHLLRDKEPTPSFAEAGICFAMIMFLQFGAMKFMQQAIAKVGMMQLLMIQQLVIIATPALFMAVMLTTDFRRTLRIKWPSWRILSFAVVLPFVLHPLSAELFDFLSETFFPKFPPSFERRLATMIDPNQPLWLVLLAFAVAPGICEEIAFRGFILSGFGRSKRIWLAIGLSSLTFGLMHMIPQQVVNAALLGIVLGLLALRSGSLLPGVVFHFIWNSLFVLHGRLGQFSAVQNVNESPWHWLVTFDQNKLHYDWPILVAMTLLGGFLIWRLVKQPTDNSPKPATADPIEPLETPLSALEKPASKPHEENPLPTA